MSVSSKVICLLVLYYVKERRNVSCDNSIYRVQTLTSKFGIATILIDTVTFFVFHMDQKTNRIYAIRDMNILHCKQGHQILIDFHFIPHRHGVYMVQV